MKIIWEGRNLWHAATTHGLYRGLGCTAWQIKTNTDVDCSKEGEESYRMLVVIFYSMRPWYCGYYNQWMSLFVWWIDTVLEWNPVYFWKEVKNSGGLLDSFLKEHFATGLCCQGFRDQQGTSVLTPPPPRDSQKNTDFRSKTPPFKKLHALSLALSSLSAVMFQCLEWCCLNG